MLLLTPAKFRNFGLGGFKIPFRQGRITTEFNLGVKQRKIQRLRVFGFRPNSRKINSLPNRPAHLFRTYSFAGRIEKHERSHIHPRAPLIKLRVIHLRNVRAR